MTTTPAVGEALEMLVEFACNPVAAAPRADTIRAHIADLEARLADTKAHLESALSTIRLNRDFNHAIANEVRAAGCAVDFATSPAVRNARAEAAEAKAAASEADAKEANRQLALYRKAVNKMDDMTEYARPGLTREQLRSIFAELTSGLAAIHQEQP